MPGALSIRRKSVAKTPYKSKSKTLRVLFQLLVIAGVVGWIAYITLERGFPRHQVKEEWIQRNGFLAISYTGLSRNEGGAHLSKDGFEKHMTALIEAGYEAITTSDIVDFFEKDSPLPDRALYIMFEGGRKDSAIYGQEGLIASGMRASMYVHTGLTSRINRTFLNSGQVGTLGRSRYWDVNSAGEQVLLPTEGEAHTFFLADYLRDKNGEAIEGPRQFEVRAEIDHVIASDMIERLTGSRPLGFLFYPANSLDKSLDPELSTINRNLMERHYSLAFTREGIGFNGRNANQWNLSRILIGKDVTPEKLVATLEMWLPNDTPYSHRDPFPESRWRVDRGGLAFTPGSLLLSGDVNRNGFAWLGGSNDWRDLEAEVVCRRSPDAEQALYFRYVSRESFIRLSLKNRRVLVQERIPGQGLLTVFAADVGDKNPATLRATLKHDRLRVMLDGEDISDQPLPLLNLEPGRVAIGVAGADAGAGTPTSEGGGPPFGAYEEMVVRPLPELWRMVDAKTAGRFEKADALDTGIVVRLTGDAAADETVSGVLLNAASIGLARYALLPEDSFDIDLPGIVNGGLPAILRDRLWTGVAFGPKPGTRWDLVADAVKRAAERGFAVSLELDSGQARELAESGLALPPMTILVKSSAQPPERRVMAALYGGHHTVLFENASDGSFEKRGLP